MQPTVKDLNFWISNNFLINILALSQEELLSQEDACLSICVFITSQLDYFIISYPLF